MKDVPTHGAKCSLGFVQIHPLCHKIEAKEQLSEMPKNAVIQPFWETIRILRQTAHSQKILHFFHMS